MFRKGKVSQGRLGFGKAGLVRKGTFGFVLLRLVTVCLVVAGVVGWGALRCGELGSVRVWRVSAGMFRLVGESWG